MKAKVSWLACIYSTSRFTSHVLWAAEVWVYRNYEIPLFSCAWSWAPLPLTYPLGFTFWIWLQACENDLPACGVPSISWGSNKQKPWRGTSCYMEWTLFSRSSTSVVCYGMSGQILSGGKSAQLCYAGQGCLKTELLMFMCRNRLNVTLMSGSWFRRP